VVRLRPLDRKLVRDVWRLKWQVLAIALLVACGVSVTTMAYSAQKALTSAQDRFYEQTRFADVFATVRRAPLSRITELERIDGVTVVDPRLVEGGLMDVPGLTRPVLVRLISLPTNSGPELNGLRLTEGRTPDPRRPDEVVALKTFLDAAGVTLGERLSAVVGGRIIAFQVVGAALSPEYVFTPSGGSFMPDDAHQAVLWAPRSTVERAGGSTGAFTAVSFKVAVGASTPAVLQAVDRILEPYGGQFAFGRDEHPSHAFIKAELKELSTSAAILPPVFLIVAAALVHLVISRVVDAEREQIGLLKAFGYGNLQAALPYVQFAVLIGVLGIVGGGLSGAWLSSAVVERYHEYFRFPELHAAMDWSAFALASAASLTVLVAGSLSATRRAFALSPAAAMSPPRPATYRWGLIDRLVPGRAIDQASRMIIRNLERFPARAAFACLGMAASLALLMGTQFVFGSLDQVLELTYFRLQRWSDSVAFADVRAGRAAAAELQRLPGVYASEPVRVTAVRIEANGHDERTRIIALEPDALLARPLDASGRPAAYQGPGIVLSQALADRLRITPGSLARLTIPEGRGPSVDLRVTGLANDFSGDAIYMSRPMLNHLLAEGDVANAAHLLVASDRRRDFYTALQRIPQVISAGSRDDTVASWRRALIEAFRVSMTFYVGFAGAIAFGVAYNMSRVTLSERARDLATLRVLGFRRRECAYILLGELMVLALAALPLGLVGGHELARGLVTAYARDELRLPFTLTAESYAVSLTAYVAAVALAAAIVGRRIWGLDMVAVLKTRE